MQSSSPGPVGTGKMAKWHLRVLETVQAWPQPHMRWGHQLGFVLLMNEMLVVPQGPAHVLGSHPKKLSSHPKKPSQDPVAVPLQSQEWLPGLSEGQHHQNPLWAISHHSQTCIGLDFPRVEKKMLICAKEQLEEESAPERSWESRGPHSDACVLWLDSKAQ